MSISAVPTFDLEESLAREGHSVIVGFDEVGRGSLRIGNAGLKASSARASFSSASRLFSASRSIKGVRRSGLSIFTVHIKAAAPASNTAMAVHATTASMRPAILRNLAGKIFGIVTKR